jgi:hypothetical protein
MRTVFLIGLAIVSGAAVALAAVPLSVSLNTVSVNAGGNGNRVYLMPNASLSGTTLYSMAVYLSGRRELPNTEFLSCDWQLNSITKSAPVYDEATGALSFTGAGSPATYAAILRTLTYQDNNPNPLGGIRKRNGQWRSDAGRSQRPCLGSDAQLHGRLLERAAGWSQRTPQQQQLGTQCHLSICWWPGRRLPSIQRQRQPCRLCRPDDD